MWKEEERGRRRVCDERRREARESGAKTLAVACPFCLIMLADAAAEGDIAVRDVGELVAEALRE